VVLRSNWPDPDYLKRGWSLIEAGPYWRIWKKNWRIHCTHPPIAQDPATKIKMQ
jgi:hypothetical protein